MNPTALKSSDAFLKPEAPSLHLSTGVASNTASLVPCLTSPLVSSDRPQSRRAAQVEGLLRSLDLGPTGTVESRSKAAAEWLHLTDDDSLNGGLEVITGRTVLILHIGTPIAQVRAPGLINIALERASVDASVIPVDIAPDHLNEAFALLRHIPNVCGALITMPHKSVAIDLVDSVEGDALAIGAINAIRVEAGKLVGANFDGIGLVAGAADVGIEFRGRSVLLIGSGGAGKAIAFALAESGVTRLTIANRTATSAEELAGRLVESFAVVYVALGPAVSGCARAIHCRSALMRSHQIVRSSTQSHRQS
jgi:shikimate 5-dehydrogenase